MAFDIKKWLTDEMKFTPEQAETMAANFTGERVAALDKTYGAAETLRTTQDAITKTQNDLKTANDRLNAEMAEWASLTAAEKKQAGELQASLEAAKVRATQLETRLTDLAVKAGVDPKTVLEGTAVIPVKEEPKVAAIDTSRFLTTDQYGPMAAFTMQLPAKLQRIEREHFALTGEHLDTEAITTEILTRAQKKDTNIDPVAIWEEQYKIADKRAAKAAADLKAQLEAEHARGVEEGRTQSAMPGPQTPGRHAPIFGVVGKEGAIQPRTSVLKRPQPEQGVRSAAAALASHKYRKPA